MQKARFLVFAGAIFLGVGVLSIGLARGSAQAGQQGATPRPQLRQRLPIPGRGSRTDSPPSSTARI